MGTTNGSYILQSRPIHKRTLGYSIQSLGRSKEKMWESALYRPQPRLGQNWISNEPTSVVLSQLILNFDPYTYGRVSSTTSMPPAHALRGRLLQIGCLARDFGIPWTSAGRSNWSSLLGWQNEPRAEIIEQATSRSVGVCRGLRLITSHVRATSVMVSPGTTTLRINNWKYHNRAYAPKKMICSM
jgi:hypothetical protein